MIRRFSCLAGFLVLIGLSLGGPVLGQKAGKKPAAPTAPDVDSDKLTPGNFLGTLKGTVAPGTDFELEILIPHLELKPGAKLGKGNQGLQRELNQITQAQTRLARARNNQQATQAIQQIQNASRNLQNALARQNQQVTNAFHVVNDKRLVEFHAGDDLIVRTMILPGGGYDEKGNPVAAPKGDELKALKGDKPNLVGYVAKPEDLKDGATVLVTLKRAPTPKPDPTMKDAPPADPKDPPATAPTGPKNIVTMIVIEKDAPDTPASPGEKKGKKNKN